MSKINVKLSDFDTDTADRTTRPVYKKRYKKNGEEYLEKTDEIIIEEDMDEKQKEINRLKEIFNIQERLKVEELLDDLNDEEFLDNLKNLTNYKECDTYEFLNKMEELKEFYNLMPNEIRQKYNNNLAKFSKEYLPNFIETQQQKLKEKYELEEQQKIESSKKYEEYEQQIKELKEKLDKGENSNV